MKHDRLTMEYRGRHVEILVPADCDFSTALMAFHKGRDALLHELWATEFKEFCRMLDPVKAQEMRETVERIRRLADGE